MGKGFYAEYPKVDAHGVPNDVVELVKVTDGTIALGIDDGYKHTGDGVRMNNMLSQLKGLLDKRVKHPVTHELVRAYVVKSHKFTPRASSDTALVKMLQGIPLKNDDTRGPHPLREAEMYDKAKHEPLIKAFLDKRGAVSAEAAEERVRVFAAAEKAAVAEKAKPKAPAAKDA